MNYLVKKATYSVVTIFLAITTIFFIMRLAPGDPVHKMLGEDSTMEEVASLRKDLGLDRSTLSQYIHYISSLIRGDLGESFIKKKKVLSLIQSHFYPTLFLALISILISSLLGIFYGVASANYKSSKVDGLIRLVSLVSISCPIFSLAPVLVYIFSIKLRLLPVSEWNGGSHMVLPVMTLSIPLSAVIIRVMRNKFLEEKNSQWVVILKAKGMHPLSVILRIVRVCMPTVMNVIAIQLSVVLAGTMITETIFDIPGMGMLLFEGIQNRDYSVVQGVILYSTIIYMVIYFLFDFINEKFDPRIRTVNA